MSRNCFVLGGLLQLLRRIWYFEGIDSGELLILLWRFMVRLMKKERQERKALGRCSNLASLLEGHGYQLGIGMGARDWRCSDSDIFCWVSPPSIFGCRTPYSQVSSTAIMLKETWSRIFSPFCKKCPEKLPTLRTEVFCPCHGGHVSKDWYLLASHRPLSRCKSLVRIWKQSSLSQDVTAASYPVCLMPYRYSFFWIVVVTFVSRLAHKGRPLGGPLNFLF